MSDKSGKTGSPEAPVLVVTFASKALLEWALHRIWILDFETKVLRFTRLGDKRPFGYIVGFGIWGHDLGKVEGAFGRQTNAKVIRWGWNCDKGVKLSLLFQTKRLLSWNISIKVGGKKISCVLVPDKGCGCCWGKHNCFLIGSKCKKFMRREA